MMVSVPRRQATPERDQTVAARPTFRAAIASLLRSRESLEAGDPINHWTRGLYWRFRNDWRSETQILGLGRLQQYEIKSTSRLAGLC